MYTITWDDPQRKKFDNGLDRGVAYVPDGVGFAWNGLTSCELDPSYNTRTAKHDGVPVNHSINSVGLTGKITAFSYPDEFGKLIGTGAKAYHDLGLIVDEQPPKPFHLTYRTGVGDALDSEVGYKLHLVWNILASPSPISHNTTSASVDLVEFEWEIVTIPIHFPDGDKLAPTSHVALDSRVVDAGVLTDIEETLYGVSSVAGECPSLDDILTALEA